MHRRYQSSSIPTEIMRSVVGISETGSITKAAKILGLSQPAISSQIKRIEHAVGGSIFQKSANGSAATELGKLVLIQAKKILEANDQLLMLRGGAPDDTPIRLGLSNIYSRRMMEVLSKAEMTNVSIYADSSAEIVKGLIDGFVDIGIYLSQSDTPPDPTLEIVDQREDEVVWVRAKDFTLSPGAPIPLLTWPGQIMHDLMVQALERKGMIYRIAFSSPDFHARIEAAKAGIGLTVLPKRLVPSSLMIANEYYLPTPAVPQMLLCARNDSGMKSNQLLDVLRSRFMNI
ncbi:LysR family transcriptional regulator [Tardiphaga sp.]|jgi:DNA-binding transcriptional LysR family regulator|uniref:LysR family transcriptional regulator n=1 Tax=Tardiphaga sp. TaxID=1926292 RepID=UPI0037DA6541